MRVVLRYRGHAYHLEGDGWRGPDGRIVHLLTWITDELAQLPASADTESTAGTADREAGGKTRGEPRSEVETAHRVAARLGAEAEVVLLPEPPWAG